MRQGRNHVNRLDRRGVSITRTEWLRWIKGRQRAANIAFNLKVDYHQAMNDWEKIVRHYCMLDIRKEAWASGLILPNIPVTTAMTLRGLPRRYDTRI